MRRAAWILLAALALLPSAYLAWTARDMPHLGQYHDDGIYWVTAKSLAEGGGYRIVSLPGQPYQTKYPPLYPLLLSVVWRLDPSFPANLPRAMLLCWLLLPVYLAASWVLMRDLGAGGWGGRAPAAALAMSPALVFLSISLMSDLLFSSLLFGSLALAWRSARPGSSAWATAGAGLLGGAAYLTRAAALPLLAAVPVWFLLRRRPRRAAVFFAVMAPAVAGWNLWVAANLAPNPDIVRAYYTDYAAYLMQSVGWREAPVFAWKNLHFLLLSSTQLFAYNVGGDSALGEFCWRLPALASIAGVVRLARREGLTPYHVFAAGFVPLLLVCPWPPDPRAVLPLFPLLAAGLWTEGSHVAGMLRSAASRPQRSGRIVAAGIGAVLVAAGGLVAWINADALFRFLPGVVAQRRELLAACRPAYGWMATHLPSDAALLAYDDPLLYLYAGRTAMGVKVAPRLYYRGEGETAARTFSEVGDFAVQHRLGYVLTTAGDYYRGELSREQGQRARRSAAGNPALRRVFQSSAAVVYQVERR